MGSNPIIPTTKPKRRIINGRIAQQGERKSYKLEVQGFNPLCGYQRLLIVVKVGNTAVEVMKIEQLPL